MQITLIQADYHNEQHGKDLVMLLNAYALDPMGGGKALSDDVQQNLVATIAKRHDFLTLLCMLMINRREYLIVWKVFLRLNANLYSISMIAVY